jgi:short-subunit dehydrogenase
MGMEQKSVVITGAASGIGLETTKIFLRNGHSVVMADRNEERLHEASSLLKNHSAQLLPVNVDVTSDSDCQRMITQTIDRFGRLDVLINNAGISMRSLFLDVDLSVLHRLMDVNFWGTVYSSFHALPHLIASKGSLVAITSIAGKHGLPGRTGYSASKFAVQGLMESIRIEHLKSGLHVLTFAPGFTRSNIRRSALMGDGTEQGDSPVNEARFMTAESVAKKLYKAIKVRRREEVLTIPGKFTKMGNCLFPKTLDKIYFEYIAREPDSPIS